MYCKHCGKEIEDNSSFCKYCGGNLGCDTTVKEVQYIAIQQPKSQFVAIILCIFLGEFGIHDFYMGKNGCGITKLLILILLGWIVVGFIINGLWCLIDLTLIAVKSDDCFYNSEEIKTRNAEQERAIQEYEQVKKERKELGL